MIEGLHGFRSSCNLYRVGQRTSALDGLVDAEEGTLAEPYCKNAKTINSRPNEISKSLLKQISRGIMNTFAFCIEGAMLVFTSATGLSCKTSWVLWTLRNVFGDHTHPISRI